MRAWAQQHKLILNFIVSLIHFFLFLTFINAAFYTAAQIPNGVPIMAVIILTMIAGFFWKGATGMQDDFYEDQTALDEVMKLREDLESNDLLDSKL